MGQYWQVIAFAPREKLGDGGQLGNVLLGRSPSRLVVHLAAPILPRAAEVTSSDLV